MNQPALMAILAGGGMAALNDGLLACIFWGVTRSASPERVFQSVSAGLLGREAAMAGGLPTALLGVVLHVVIAIGMATAFVLTAQRVPALLRWPWPLVGLAYGAVLYAVMHGVVVPLSRASAPPFWWPWAIADVGSHLLLCGLPIVWAARHWLVAAPPVRLGG
jgi:uncharacterized membrane protein YagU involved in acid resistance